MESSGRHAEHACYFGKHRKAHRGFRQRHFFEKRTMFELFDAQAEVRIEKGTNLPHWFQPGVSYFVTFRTDDSIPADVARRWRFARTEWLARHGILTNDPNWKLRFQQLAEPLRREFHETFSKQYMDALDRGLG